MKTVIYCEMPNGARYLSQTGNTTRILEELTKTEFTKRFPNEFIDGFTGLITYLENGAMLLDSEWNGESYCTIEGKCYKPLYHANNSSQTEIIGFYEC